MNGDVVIGILNDGAKILFNPKTKKGAIVAIVIENGVERMGISDNPQLDRAELQDYLQKLLMSFDSFDNDINLTKEGERFLRISF